MNQDTADRFAGLREANELNRKYLMYVHILRAFGLSRREAALRAVDFVLSLSRRPSVGTTQHNIMNKLEEIRKLRAQGMSLAEAKAVVSPKTEPLDNGHSAMDDLRQQIVVHARWLRRTFNLPLIDALDQAKHEFHYHEYKTSKI